MTDLFFPFVRKDETWKQRAACAGLDTNLFFPVQKRQYTEARLICGRCPVRLECLDYARRTGPRQPGMFGGLSPEERHMRRPVRDDGRRYYIYEDFNGRCRKCGQMGWDPVPDRHLCMFCRPGRKDGLHCPEGHLLSEANIYRTSRGGRECRICRSTRARKWRNQRKETSQ